ncbi:hypothetical protein KC351_g6164 [Hortaea werneckii]|nr:hypothetical protein KC351_g6164 [Hortaea werneckii]
MPTSRSSSTETDGSLAPYRTPETSPPFHGYDYQAIKRDRVMAKDTHYKVPAENRSVTIVVKDAHDVDGSGMLFTLGLYASFKNVFDTFKAHTCTVCRDPEKIRFKADGKKLAAEDTPKKVRVLIPLSPFLNPFVNNLSTPPYPLPNQANHPLPCFSPPQIFPALLHNQSLSIKAFSNAPGLKCARCKTHGYATTSPAGVVFDGHVPYNGAGTGKKSLRLHFQDPDGRVTAIEVGFREPLKGVMRAYARQVGSEMGMKNRSVIVVHMFCIAG